MSDLRQQKGNHTWDLIIDYYCCPKCAYIFENREQFENRLGILQKELHCPRCHYSFTVNKFNR